MIERSSPEKTPWAIACSGDPDIGYEGCGLVYLTEAEYERQMERPDSHWSCPLCGFGIAEWAGDE